MNTKINNVAKEIAERNKLFKQASPADKRVLIAKDVINLIESKKIIPTSGEWVSPDYSNYNDHDYDAMQKHSFQKTFLEGSVKKCECCALGSMMVSCTLFKNKVKMAQLDDGAMDYPTIQNHRSQDFMGFRNIFSHDQCMLIEIAFEQGKGYFFTPETEDPNDINSRAIKFGKKYRSNKSRLLAIMKNVVKNKGTFKP
jgi:hypothetical protein